MSTLQAKVNEVMQSRGRPEELVQRLENADSETLLGVISQSGSTGQTGAEYAAVREAAVAIHQSRLADRVESTMKRLNVSATILYWVGIVVAIVIGVAEIVVPLIARR